MANVKKSFLFFIFILSSLFVFSVQNLSAEENVHATVKESGEHVATEGFEAFRAEEWTTAVFLLKKAVYIYDQKNPDTMYMLVMAEIKCEDYNGALSDCDVFLSSFPSSPYAPYIRYQKGRVSYYLGDYDSAVMILSDFCHEYPESEMYPSALFWIAESFYVACRYSTAKGLYERIVEEFPYDSKALEAQYRIETIDQRSREEKLLYLLRMTGEEYLAAKENYEKQLRESRTGGLVSLQRQLKAEKDKNTALASALEEQKNKNAELQETVDSLQRSLDSAGKVPAVNTDILFLKRKAEEIEKLMNNSKAGAQ